MVLAQVLDQEMREILERVRRREVLQGHHQLSRRALQVRQAERVLGHRRQVLLPRKPQALEIPRERQRNQARDHPVPTKAAVQALGIQEALSKLRMLRAEILKVRRPLRAA